jgi:hypothetical protein
MKNDIFTNTSLVSLAEFGICANANLACLGKNE